MTTASTTIDACADAIGKGSQTIFAQAQSVLVGGVNSPVRAFRAVGGTPPVIARGEGASLWDVDGRQYLDYVCSWGAMILGHAHPKVVAAVCEAAGEGMSFGAPTPREGGGAGGGGGRMTLPERIRFVNSGTEATMSALRLARGATRRDKIVKFAGCYHGHADGLLVQAGSGALTLGQPDSAGVPAAYAAETLVAPYDDVAAVAALFASHGADIAAVIVEPIAGNMGMVIPSADFLPAVRRLCDTHGALLIFDEVMTGFRVGLTGAQGLYGIRPDLSCFGKVIGGGLPMAAFGGRRELMEQLAPLGPVYQAGTLSGNPLAMAAGIAVLQELTMPGVYERLHDLTAALTTGISAALRAASIEHAVAQQGGMWGLRLAAPDQFPALFHQLLARGIYLAPSAFEAGFISLAHTEADIEKTIKAATATALPVAGRR